jgi:hypothetical protein
VVLRLQALFSLADLRAGRYRAVHLQGKEKLFEAAWLGVACLVRDRAPGDAVQRANYLTEVSRPHLS